MTKQLDRLVATQNQHCPKKTARAYRSVVEHLTAKKTVRISLLPVAAGRELRLGVARLPVSVCFVLL